MYQLEKINFVKLHLQVEKAHIANTCQLYMYFHMLLHVSQTFSEHLYTKTEDNNKTEWQIYKVNVNDKSEPSLDDVTIFIILINYVKLLCTNNSHKEETLG